MKAVIGGMDMQLDTSRVANGHPSMMFEV